MLLDASQHTPQVQRNPECPYRCIHGNGYVSSRMAPVWVYLDGDLVKEATEGLVRSTEVPRWRISDGGHRAKDGRR